MIEKIKDKVSLNGTLHQRAEKWADDAVLKLIGRLVVTAGVPMIGAATVWLGTTVWALNSQQARLEAKIQIMTSTLEIRLDDIYNGTDAVKDFQLRDLKNQEQDARLQNHEERIDRLEESRINRGSLHRKKDKAELNYELHP